MNQNNIKPQELRATDLRIGNIFKEKYTGDIFIVSELTKDRITFEYQTNEKWQAEPITLSEEVLLKCGFEKTPNHENFYFITLNDWTKIYVSFFEDRFAVELSVSKHSFCPRVNSLHQLQNLFYSLTGEELEVRCT